MTDRPLVIVNPRAGGVRAASEIEALKKVIEGALGGVDFALTERPRHATELAETAAKAGRKVIVATGGDGSIHEVVNGIMAARAAGATGSALGIIGRGTGGDLCRTLGLEHKLDRYLAAIAAGVSRGIDVGRFSYAPSPGDAGPPRSGFFVNILSAGMSGLVDRYVHDMARWAGGKAGYFLASARALLASEMGVVRLRLELAGEKTDIEASTRMIAFCNGRYFGSGMFVAPMAEPDDGIFEVIDLGASSKVGFALRNGAVYSGSHLKQPEVHHHRCDKATLELVNVRARETFLLDVDGEPLGAPPLSIEVLPRALPVLLPPDDPGRRRPKLGEPPLDGAPLHG